MKSIDQQYHEVRQNYQNKRRSCSISETLEKGASGFVSSPSPSVHLTLLVREENFNPKTRSSMASLSVDSSYHLQPLQQSIRIFSLSRRGVFEDFLTEAWKIILVCSYLKTRHLIFILKDIERFDTHWVRSCEEGAILSISFFWWGFAHPNSFVSLFIDNKNNIQWQNPNNHTPSFPTSMERRSSPSASLRPYADLRGAT
jgi:hypothetical protein